MTSYAYVKLIRGSVQAGPGRTQLTMKGELLREKEEEMDDGRHLDTCRLSDWRSRIRHPFVQDGV